MLPGFNLPLLIPTSALNVADVFSTTLYTGNGSARSIVTGHKTDMAWIKSRSATTNHAVYDAVRGATFDLVTNSTAAQTTQAQGVTAFNADGFSIGTLAKLNTNSATYVAWTFRRAPKFFDIDLVSHTNGVATNIGLSPLGVIGMAVAKITTTTGDWLVWHRSLSASNNLRLNTTAAQTTTNAWLSVSGTTLTISASAPTGSYHIQGYAHDTDPTGVIQCGSYTGNGSLTGPVINLGWEPQWVLIKGTSFHTTDGSWWITDAVRGTFETSAGTDQRLGADLPSTETAATNYIEATSTGFQLKNSDLKYNGNSHNYIYMAIRAEGA